MGALSLVPIDHVARASPSQAVAGRPRLATLSLHCSLRSAIAYTLNSLSKKVGSPDYRVMYQAAEEYGLSVLIHWLHPGAESPITD